MKKNNEIIRTCIVCREKKDKSHFIRIVKSADNNFFVDKTNKASGRGCYVCNHDDCLGKLKKSRALNRAFKTNIDEEIYDGICEESKKS